MIDELLRDTFARHEELVPTASPSLRSAIAAGARRRRLRRRWISSSAAALVVVLASLVPLVLPNRDDHVMHSDSLLADTSLPSAPLHFLLLGTDRQAAHAGDQVRADAILLLHIDPATRTAYQVSIPRDLQLELPGFGAQQANSAYLFGGYTLTAQSITALTGVPIDGGVVVDFAGMQTVTQAVGGVDLCVDQRTESTHLGYDGQGKVGPLSASKPMTPVVYEAGCRHFAAWEALDYLRQRQSATPEDRDRHLRQFLAALVKQLSDPTKLSRALPVATQSLDLHLDGRSLATMAGLLSHIDAGKLPGIRLPTRLSNGHVQPAPDADGLFTALRSAQVPAWLAAHPQYAS